jgi:hypothetical protein
MHAMGMGDMGDYVKAKLQQLEYMIGLAQKQEARIKALEAMLPEQIELERTTADELREQWQAAYQRRAPAESDG